MKRPIFICRNFCSLFLNELILPAWIVLRLLGIKVIIISRLYLSEKNVNWLSRERKFPRTFAPRSKSSRELSFPGVKVPANFRSRERKFSVGTFAPRIEKTEERKVLIPFSALVPIRVHLCTASALHVVPSLFIVTTVWRNILWRTLPLTEPEPLHTSQVSGFWPDT